MTVLNKEMKENRRVELTIRVERQEWQQALDDAYQANRDLYPVDGCAPGKATRQALEQAYAPDVFYQEAVNATFPRALVEAFGREEILVAGAPELRIVDIGPEGFTFAALAELYPEPFKNPILISPYFHVILSSFNFAFIKLNNIMHFPFISSVYA